MVDAPEMGLRFGFFCNEKIRPQTADDRFRFQLYEGEINYAGDGITKADTESVAVGEIAMPGINIEITQEMVEAGKMRKREV